MDISGGLITLLGSGETSLAGGRIFENIVRQLKPPVRIAMLETPAGFELNSTRVAERVTEFLASRLQNFSPHMDIIPARKRGTDFSPDDPVIVSALAKANLIFMGPGSPTYAVRQLQSSLAWDLVRIRQHRGSALLFASAAVIAVGRWCLPVYEIYKVGQDMFTLKGLDFFSDFGLKLSFIPHWNNSDGGSELDTSRCFIGESRFRQWLSQLPEGETVIGLDEQTGLTFDFSSGMCQIRGGGSIHLLQEDRFESFYTGMEFPITRLGQIHQPDSLNSGILPAALELAASMDQNEIDTPPKEVVDLLAERSRARHLKNWSHSDRMRDELVGMGWEVQDMPDEQVVIKKLETKRDQV